MALDHVRDYTTIVRFQPDDMSKTSVALFATRWITHFCAPTFCLLAGVGIGIMMQRGKRSPREVSTFLLKRGIWLLFLELIITPIGWGLSLQLVPAFALVLWALGWSMIIMALLVHLPRMLLAVFSLAMIFGHNLLDSIDPSKFGALGGGIWHMLHVPGFIIPGKLFVAYPLIPWVAVMCSGFVLAAVYDWDAPRRQRFLLATGAAAFALFFVVRGINHYGNILPWSAQRTTGLTIASFFNVMKYPPSLDFLLMTLGPALMALAFAEKARGRFASFLLVYGRVPLFFYVTHIFVAHLLAILIAFAQGGEWRRIQVITNSGAIPDWFGLPLPGVYAVWAVVVLLLYYPCRRFSEMKNTRTDWWLQYM